MNKRLALFTATTLSIGLFSGAANSISVPTADIPENPNPNLNLTKIQLTIQKPAKTTCPTAATLTARIFTNQPGPVQYHIIRNHGAIDGPFPIEAKKDKNGTHSASFSKEIRISASINSQYKISAIANYTTAQSEWVTLVAHCT